MVKVTFNSALAQKEAKKDEPKSSEEALIIPPDAVAVDCKDPDDVVPAGQRRAWCWCMCFGLAFMLAGAVLGGAYLYKYFALQPDDVYYCGLKYIKDDVILNEPSADAPVARYQTIEENIKIFEEDEVEFISVPVPEFADSDPANIVHDFNKKLTAYLDLNLDKCYVIPLNTSIVMPPRNLLELLINIKAGTYLPQSYLIHEHMVITDRIENVDHLGFFIYRLCHDKETYKLQRRETIRGFKMPWLFRSKFLPRVPYWASTYSYVERYIILKGKKKSVASVDLYSPNCVDWKTKDKVPLVGACFVINDGSMIPSTIKLDVIFKNTKPGLVGWLSRQTCALVTHFPVLFLDGVQELMVPWGTRLFVLASEQLKCTEVLISMVFDRRKRIYKTRLKTSSH
ncbi:hypothetical protein STEG23_012211, partial [Scotinomys teguina]